MADSQIDRAPTDFSRHPRIKVVAFHSRWPKQFTKLSESALNDLREVFVQLLELGCLFHLVSLDVPRRPDSLRVFDSSELRKVWLTEHDQSESMMATVERDSYHGAGTASVATLVQNAPPIFKSYGFKLGLFSSPVGEIAAFTKSLFYSGALLAVNYDLCVVEDGKLKAL